MSIQAFRVDNIFFSIPAGSLYFLLPEFHPSYHNLLYLYKASIIYAYYPLLMEDT